MIKKKIVLLFGMVNIQFGRTDVLISGVTHIFPAPDSVICWYFVIFIHIIHFGGFPLGRILQMYYVLII